MNAAALCASWEARANAALYRVAGPPDKLTARALAGEAIQALRGEFDELLIADRRVDLALSLDPECWLAAAAKTELWRIAGKHENVEMCARYVLMFCPPAEREARSLVSETLVKSLVDSGAQSKLGARRLAEDLLRVPDAKLKEARRIAIAPPAFLNRPAMRSLLGHVYFKLELLNHAFWCIEDESIERDSWNPSLHMPVWDGITDLSGKRVVILDAKGAGIGDYVWVARYSAFLAEKGATVFAQARRRLAPLIATANEISLVVCEGDQLPEHDFVVRPFGLPTLCGIQSWENIFWRGPYLHPPASNVNQWRQRIRSVAPGGLHVGVTWSSGGADAGNDFGRWVDFRDLAPLFEIPGVHFFSLQRGPRARDCEGSPLHCIEDPAGSLLDAAALIKAMDLIVSIDAGPVHIAGAMNVPCWTMLPVWNDPRWSEQGERTPWYPSMRLFRQRSVGNWAPVIREMAAELRAVRDGRPP